MRQLDDKVWQSMGTSWIWDESARNLVCATNEALPMRQFLQKALAGNALPDNLPSNDAKALVVAGLEGYLDLLTPNDGEQWLRGELKQAILSFQDEYEGQAALVFWLPTGKTRVKIEKHSSAVMWQCSSAQGGGQINFGLSLWGAPNDYPQEIILQAGNKPAGLYYRRFS
jgi:hypothetical protein